jgi:hypothetical protein
MIHATRLRGEIETRQRSIVKRSDGTSQLRNSSDDKKRIKKSSQRRKMDGNMSHNYVTRLSKRERAFGCRFAVALQAEIEEETE